MEEDEEQSWTECFFVSQGYTAPLLATTAHKLTVNGCPKPSDLINLYVHLSHALTM